MALLRTPRAQVTGGDVGIRTPRGGENKGRATQVQMVPPRKGRWGASSEGGPSERGRLEDHVVTGDMDDSSLARGVGTAACCMWEGGFREPRKREGGAVQTTGCNGGAWSRAGPQRLCRGAQSDAREPERTAELDLEQSHATAQDTTKGWVSESGQTISLHHSLLLFSLLPWSAPLFSIPCLLAHRPCSEVTVRTWAGAHVREQEEGEAALSGRLHGRAGLGSAGHLRGVPPRRCAVMPSWACARVCTFLTRWPLPRDLLNALRPQKVNSQDFKGRGGPGQEER